MWKDEIVEEVRRIREAYAAQFNYDLKAIQRDLQELVRKSGRETVSFPPRRIQPVKPGSKQAVPSPKREST